MDIKVWLVVVVAEVIMVLALFAGIAKCWSISRRPMTNAKCVLALQLVLVGWLIWVGCLCLSTVLRTPLPFLGVVSLTSSGIILSAAVLAVVGLREYSRGRGCFGQGRVQAVSALIASLLITVFPILVLVEARWNVLGTRSSPAGARVLVFDDLNFRFFAPGGRWIKVETNSLNPEAALALARKRPEIYFIVVAHKVPIGGYSLADFAKVVQADFGNSVGGVRTVYSGSTWIEQLEGLRLDSQAEQSGQKFYYQMRLFVSSGFGYQLVAWGRQPDENIVAEEIKFLARRFEPGDFSRKTGTNSAPPARQDQRPVRSKI